MEKNERINQNYKIIESLSAGNTEIVIGYHPKAALPYACWYCKNETDYYWGSYYNNLSDARNKLIRRYLIEIEDEKAREIKDFEQAGERLKEIYNFFQPYSERRTSVILEIMLDKLEDLISFCAAASYGYDG